MRGVIVRVISAHIKLLRYLLKQLMCLEKYFRENSNLDLHRKNVIRSTQKYDMYAEPNERYYAQQYWQRIQNCFESEHITTEGKFLDLGCGQGRLTIPLAKWCRANAEISAVDSSGTAIRQGALNAEQENIKNIKFIVDDILSYLKKMPDNYFDAVLMVEVVFFLPNYREVLSELKRVMKSDAVFIASFRTQYFNLVYCLKHGLWGSLDQIMIQRSGEILGNSTLFNWHTIPEITALLEQDLELSIRHLSGIGVCSGIVGDPLSDIVMPSMLSQKEKIVLMKLENEMGEKLPDMGRYVLVIARAASQ